jgi:phage tail sheath gpL-like
MAIQFNNIPLGILTPGMFAEFDSSKAIQGIQLAPHDVLLMGQKLSAGSATAGQVYRVRNYADALVLFGEGSQLAEMVAAYKGFDTATPVYCVGVADASGTNAAGSFVYSGTATEAGELVHYIAGRRISVAVPSGTTAAQLETAALAALAVFTDDGELPVTYAANTGTGVDLTAQHDGAIGNQIMLGVGLRPGERTPAGITVTVTAMASGATDASYSGVITAMGEDQYSSIAIGVQDTTALGLLVTEMESRWGPLRAIEGQVFAAKYDTAANLATYGANFNSQTLTVIGGEKSALMPAPWEVAAQTAAISAHQAQVDPSVAMVGVTYANMSAAQRGSRFSRADRQTLLEAGIATVRAASDGRLATDFLITTYQTNAQSVADSSLRPLYRVRALAAYRYSLVTRIAAKFGGFKLADDGNEISGQKMVTPAIMRSEICAHFLDCQEKGWVENFKQFQKELIVQRNADNLDRLDAVLPPDFINAFLVGAFQIQFRQ